MKIGVVSCCGEGSGGIFQYTAQVIESLAGSGRFEAVPLFAPKGSALSGLPGVSHVPLPPDLFTTAPERDANLTGDGLSARAPGCNRRANEFFRGHGVDLLIYPAPIPLSFECGIPYVMAVHDLQHRLQPRFPEVASGGQWAFREYLFRNGAAFAGGLLADSRTGREDILACYEPAPERVHVLPFVPRHRPRGATPEALAAHRARLSLPPRFFFYPAQFWLHKNHARVVHALHILKSCHGLEAPLVLTGLPTGGPPAEARAFVFANVMTLAEDLHVSVRHLGFVPEDIMEALYRSAEALVMPTFFGPTNIPVLEAFGFGCPVLTSDIRGIREQAGGAALLVNPNDAGAIAGGLRRLWTEPGLRAAFAEAGKKRLAAFTTGMFTERLLAAIDKAGGRPSPGKPKSAKRRGPPLSAATGSFGAGAALPGREPPLVSALVSAWNAGRFMRGCLDDLLSQTIANRLEIIVVVSGSEGGEAAVVREYRERHENVVLIETAEREGIYAAWNRGLRAARGVYVTNANTDDRHAPHALERLARTLDENPGAALAYADVAVTRRENELFGAAPPDGWLLWPDFDPETLFVQCYCGPQPMWRRSLHERHGLFDETFLSAGDYEFWLRLAAGGERFVHVPEVLGLYLASPESAERRDPGLSADETRRARDAHWSPARGPMPRGRLPLYMAAAPGARCDAPPRPAPAAPPRPPEALLAEGEASFHAGDFVHARACFETARELMPSDHRPWNNLAVMALGEGKPLEALEHLRHALELSPEDPDALVNSARALALSGEPATGARCLRLYLEGNPKDAEGWAEYERLLRAADAWSPEGVGPEAAGVYLAAGEGLLGAGDLQGAAEALVRAHALSPAEAGPLALLGSLHRRAGDGAEALACFDAALARSPRFREAVIKRGETLAELGRPEEASEALRRYLAGGEDSEVRRALADLFARGGGAP